MRLFIAINLPADVRAAVQSAQKQLRAALPFPSLRWVRPEVLHLTLRFLGDVPMERIPTVIAALRDAAHDTGTLRLALEDIGCFPNERAPRVLHVSVGGERERLRALQARLESAVAPFCGRDDKAFHPHITIARVKEKNRNEARQVGAALAKVRPGVSAGWDMSSVELMSSDLQPSGPVYAVVESVELN